MLRCAPAMLLLCWGIAEAEPRETAVPRTYVNVRAGGSIAAASGDKVSLCGEWAPAHRFSLEMCGAGGGLLHHDNIADMFHLQVKFFAVDIAAASGHLRIAPGVGFSEIELGGDELGFTFGQPGPGARSVAGPSASVSVSWVRALGADIEFLANASFNVGYFHYAGALALPRDRWQPSLGLQVGIGY